MLELKNISYHTLKSGKKDFLLRNISFSLDEGIVAVTGANGCGKTTLVNLIAGLLAPSQGKIILDGETITALPADKRALLGMAYAFQRPVQFQGISIRTLLSLAAHTEDPLRLNEVMREVGLPQDYLERIPDRTLSGGEAKRLELATAFARNTKVSLFDEPEAGIDLWSLDRLIQIFQRKKSEGGQLFLIVTHEKRILEIADEIILMEHGRIQNMGNKEEILPLLSASPSSYLESCRTEAKL